MAENTVVYTGTGRRKEAVARVRLVPGTGKVVVNGREAIQYFGRQQLVDNAVAPLRVTETAERFDVLAKCDGGGITGQAGALRLGIARALLDAGEYREDLKKAPFSTPASTVRTSRRLASSPVTPAPSSARSTASRRPASARSSPSAKPCIAVCLRARRVLLGGPFCLPGGRVAPFRGRATPFVLRKTALWQAARPDRLGIRGYGGPDGSSRPGFGEKDQRAMHLPGLSLMARTPPLPQPRIPKRSGHAGCHNPGFLSVRPLPAPARREGRASRVCRDSRQPPFLCNNGSGLHA